MEEENNSEEIIYFQYSNVLYFVQQVERSAFCLSQKKCRCRTKAIYDFREAYSIKISYLPITSSLLSQAIFFKHCF